MKEQFTSIEDRSTLSQEDINSWTQNIFIENLIQTIDILQTKYDKFRLSDLSDSVKNNSFNEETIISDIKWCKKLLVPYDKDDVMKVIADFTGGEKPDYKNLIMEAIENNDAENIKKYKNYIEIFNITNIIIFLEMKQKSAKSS